MRLDGEGIDRATARRVGRCGEEFVVRERDQAEYVEFVQASHAALYRTSYLLAGNHHTAEDLLQNVLTKMYVSWSRVRDVGNLQAYARRALVNESISLHRRRWTREVPSESPAELAAAFRQVGIEDAVVESQVVWEALRGLTGRRRAVVVLRYYEDLPDAEIAEVLGISPGTVRSHVHAALAVLATALEAPRPALVEEERS